MPSRYSSNNFASIVVFISASLWGLYWLPLRYIEAQGVSAGWAIFLINAPAAIVTFFYLLWHCKRYKNLLSHAALIGFFTGLGLALYASGLVFSSVVRATLLFYLTAIWSTLIGLIWLKERVNLQRWIAICAGLTGLVLIVSGGDDAVALNIGDAFALFSGIAWAIGAAMIKRSNQVPLASTVAFESLFVCFFAFILVSWAGEITISMPTIIDLSPMVIAVSLVVVLPSTIAIFWAQKLLFPGRVGLLMMSEVLVATISASILIPEESMTFIEWAGAALIIGACLIEIFSETEKTPNTLHQ